jgi:phosphatidylinositol alpha-mannosyltransferase
VRAPNLKRFQRELVPAVTMIPAMAWRLKRLKPDVVHAFSYHDAIAARLAGIPYLVWYGGIILPRSFLRVPFQYWLFRKASRRARIVACPSRAAAEAMERDYGFAAEIVPNGLDVDAFAASAPTEPGRILSAATPNDSRKRPEFLVEAFNQVAAADASARLVFCGAASDDVQQGLLSVVPAETRDRITFLGEVPQAELSAEFARASVSALTSLNEAFGLVLVESMAAGTPVVGTRSGAVPELVDDGVGGLFDPDDVAGCAAQLERVLRDSGPEMSARCVARARQYDWDAVGPKIVALYERVSAAP